MTAGNNNNQTKMAMALTIAMKRCGEEGRNSGRVGHRILTNNAKRGINGKPAQRKAESAVGVNQ
jgi:hypothetical protein